MVSLSQRGQILVHACQVRLHELQRMPRLVPRLNDRPVDRMPFLTALLERSSEEYSSGTLITPDRVAGWTDPSESIAIEVQPGGTTMSVDPVLT